MTATGPQELVERALEFSRTDGCVIIAEETTSANLRWAANSLTTNGAMRSRALTVIATVDGASGSAAGVLSRTGVAAGEIEALVRAAEAAAAASAPAEDAAPLVSPADLPAGLGGEWDAPPAETSIGVFGSFAPALGDAFGQARAGGRALYGFAEHDVTSTYLGTSTGVRLRHDQPAGTVELTGRSADQASSAWAGVATRDFGDVDVADLDATLATRLGWAQRRVELGPGRYETLLPPSAVADLMVYLYWTATGRDAAEGRTVFSAPEGATRVGESLATLPLTLRSDPNEPGLQSSPFEVAHASGSGESVFDNGLPLTATDWLRDGRLTTLLYNRADARRAGVAASPPVGNLVLDGGGTRDLAAMVAGTERGLLVTCLWYIREVDPRTLLLTGLTRDGVYLVEGGEVTGVVTNYRFNESPVDLLRRATEAGRREATLPREWSDFFTRAAMPTLRIPDFNMSTVSQAS